MFGFLKKSVPEEDLKLMFDMEVLELAFEKAIENFRETGLQALKLCGAGETEAKEIVELDVLRVKAVMINVKQILIKGGDLK